MSAELPAARIIHADDFGWSVRINRGIVWAHRIGVVSSCSALVSGPAAEHAARLVRRYSTLGVGLHVSFTTGGPTNPAKTPALARAMVAIRQVVGGPNPRVLNPDDLAVVEAQERAVPFAEVVEECESQYERFLDLFGHPPTHIDTHQHIHLRPAFFEAIAQLALRHSAPVRQITDAMRYQLVRRGIRTPDRFIEISTRDCTADRTTDELLDALAGAAGVTEILVHPGFVPRRKRAGGSCRAVHLQALASPEVRELLRDNPPVTYAAIRCS